MPMSDTQTVWLILCQHAAADRDPTEPFEIAEVSPAVAKALAVPDAEARRLVGLLLTELDRLPDGRKIFRREGDAVVPQPGFLKVPRDPKGMLDAYPYEL